MIVLTYLGSQCAKFHAAGWRCSYLEPCMCPDAISDSRSEAAACLRLRGASSNRLRRCDLLSRVIAGDESWIYGYDRETKQQYSQLKNKEQSQEHAHHFHFFVLGGQTDSSAYYCDALRRLRENVLRLRPEF
jgi:hypothetical protein